MSKRVQVLGMDIDNHTIRENMFLLEEYVNTDGLNFACILTPEILMAASESPDIYKILERMDMHVIGDVAILEVLEDVYEQQVGEVLSKDLEEIFLQALVRKRKTVYWVSDQPGDYEELMEYVGAHYPKLNVAGKFTGDLEDDKVETLINEINSVAPDVILLQTASTQKLEILMEYKNQLNARLCIYMNYRMRSKYYTTNKNSKIKSLIDTTVFKRKAIRFQNIEDE